MTTLSNSPPLKDRLEIEYQSLANDIDVALMHIDHPSRPITTEDQAVTVGSAAAGLVKVRRKVEKARKNEKDGFLEGGRTVDRFFEELASPLVQAIESMDKKVKDYQRAKLAEQRKAEEAERQMAATFGEQAPVSAPVKEAVRITTDAGVKVAGKVVWKFDVVDVSLVPREYLVVNETAIRTALQAAKALGKKIEDVQIPGIRAYEDVGTIYR